MKCYEKNGKKESHKMQNHERRVCLQYVMKKKKVRRKINKDYIKKLFLISNIIDKSRKQNIMTKKITNT
jgi:hypothetical protein